MSEHTQPHDRFFSKVFSRMETVEDILVNNIPLLSNLLVPGSLEDCREKFVNPELGKYYSDLLLKAKLMDGKEVNIFLLLEHKSHHKRDVAFDLLRYEVRIWETLKKEGQQMPFILPIVIYHGKERWSSDKHFASLVDTPAGMEMYTPQFHFYLYDLSQYRDEEIQGEILSRVILLLFKYIYDDGIGERFVSICKKLRDVGDEKTVLEFMRSVLEYIGNATDKITIEQVREGVEQALPTKGEKLMPTIAEQFREEGRKEGRGEGLLEGLQGAVQLGLELKYGQQGLDFYQSVKKIHSLETLENIKEALRRGASIDELEQLLKGNGTEKS